MFSQHHQITPAEIFVLFPGKMDLFSSDWWKWIIISNDNNNNNTQEQQSHPDNMYRDPLIDHNTGLGLPDLLIRPDAALPTVETIRPDP